MNAHSNVICIQLLAKPELGTALALACFDILTCLSSLVSLVFSSMPDMLPKKRAGNKKNYETYNRGEGFQLFARKIRQERSKGNHFLVLIYYYLFTI